MGTPACRHARATPSRGDGAPFEAELVRVPAVVGHGTATSERHRRAAVEMEDALPDAELRTIDGAGHNAHDTNPGEFADFVRRTVARSSAI
jgi:pimeloyl-ACP methyl ester carboxylesterase